MGRWGEVAHITHLGTVVVMTRQAKIVKSSSISFNLETFVVSLVTYDMY